jgi:hypothetical protein
MKTATFLAVLLVLSASRPRAQEPTAPVPPASGALPDRVALYVTGEEEYAGIRVEPGHRTAPDARDRLVVFHEGGPVLDLGLRNERRLVPVAGSATEQLEEEGILENAEISPDGRAAVILSTRFRRPAETGDAPTENKTPPPRGTTILTFVDARWPDARFDLPIPQGRWVREVLPLSAGLGVAVSTTRGIGEPADLGFYGPDGHQVFHVSATEASVIGLTATLNGAFLAASLAYPDRPNLPNRGIRVFDLLRNSKWTYHWSYGAEDEPTSWSLQESGALDIRLPGRILLLDRTGAAISNGRSR